MTEASHEHEACASYNRDGDICRSGFIQRSYCRGYGGCHASGAINPKYLPHCLSEDPPSRFLTESGLPLFYARAAK